MFHAQPLLRPLRGTDAFRLEEPLVWDDGRRVITVPPGFRTDLASVPRVAQPIIPKTGPYTAAAVLHDYLFVVQDHSFAATNALFRDAMACCGVRLTQRWLIWAAVTAGGWLPWLANAGARAADLRGFLRAYGLEGEGV